MSVERAPAEPLNGISSMATRHALAELAQTYEQQSEQRVHLVCAGGVDVVRRIEAGETFDFVVLAANAIDALANARYVDAQSRVDLARSGIAVAVKAGARRPDVASERAVRDAVLAARTIGCSTGPSGAHLARLLERWGIAGAVVPRLVRAPPGVPVGKLVARGEVELGFQQLSELLGLPDVDVVGSLPPEIQDVTVFRGAVCIASRHPRTAKAFLAFLASRQATAAKRRYGLDSAAAAQ